MKKKKNRDHINITNLSRKTPGHISPQNKQRNKNVYLCKMYKGNYVYLGPLLLVCIVIFFSKLNVSLHNSHYCLLHCQ